MRALQQCIDCITLDLQWTYSDLICKVASQSISFSLGLSQALQHKEACVGQYISQNAKADLTLLLLPGDSQHLCSFLCRKHICGEVPIVSDEQVFVYSCFGTCSPVESSLGRSFLGSDEQRIRLIAVSLI